MHLSPPCTQHTSSTTHTHQQQQQHKQHHSTNLTPSLYATPTMRSLGASFQLLATRPLALEPSTGERGTRLAGLGFSPYVARRPSRQPVAALNSAVTAVMLPCSLYCCQPYVDQSVGSARVSAPRKSETPSGVGQMVSFFVFWRGVEGGGVRGGGDGDAPRSAVPFP